MSKLVSGIAEDFGESQSGSSGSQYPRDAGALQWSRVSFFA